MAGEPIDRVPISRASVPTGEEAMRGGSTR